MAVSQGVIASTPSLFPVRHKVVWLDPTGLGTADCKMFARCDDSCEYAVKDHKSHPRTPHSEWFCTHLAHLVGIPGPHCAVLEMLDGSTAFGSRWLDGAIAVKQKQPTDKTWPLLIQDGTIPIANVSPALSRIYAFDHFVNNVDRHGGNFLFLKAKTTYSVLAFDYSRAWFFGGFPLSALPVANSKTVRFQRQLTALIGAYIDPAEAKAVLDKIKSVPVTKIQQIIDDHPGDWIDPTQRQAILDWWSSPDMAARADGIALGIANGSYL